MVVSSQSQKKQTNLLLKQIIILTLLGIAIVVVIITSIISRQQKTLTKSHAAGTCYDGGKTITSGFAAGSCEYGKDQQVIDHPDKVFYVNQEDTDLCSGCVLTLYQGNFPYGQCNYANPNVCRRGDYIGGCSGVCNWVCCSGKSSQDGDAYNTQNQPGSSGLPAEGGGEGPPPANVPPPPSEQSPTTPPSSNGQPPADRSTTTTAPTSAVDTQVNYIHIYNRIPDITIRKISFIARNSYGRRMPEEISRETIPVNMKAQWEKYTIDLNEFGSGKYACKSVSSDSVEVSLSDASGSSIGYDRDDCSDGYIRILININKQILTKTPTPTPTKTPTPTPRRPQANPSSSVGSPLTASTSTPTTSPTTTVTPTPTMGRCYSRKEDIITFEGCTFYETDTWAICDDNEPVFNNSGCIVYRICANNNTYCLYRCSKGGEDFNCRGANDSQTGNFIYIINSSGRDRTIDMLIEKVFLVWNTSNASEIEKVVIKKDEKLSYDLKESFSGRYDCSSFGLKSIRVTLFEEKNSIFESIGQVTDLCTNGVRIVFELK